MVTLFAASLLAVFRWETCAREGRATAALRAALLAGAASVAGALTKLGFLGTLPLLCALQIAAFTAPGVGIAVKARALATFLCAGSLVFALLSQIIDWREFWDAWLAIANVPAGTFEMARLLPGLEAENIVLTSELPFLACEHLMMDLARAGADRQEVHERLRVATHKAAEACLRGEPNPLVELLAEDRLLAPHAAKLRELCEPSRCTGRAEQQVVEYVEGELDPLLSVHRDPAERSGRAEV